ncbi:MAG TPA: Rrf2 family transcriptional regulator [Chthoniobacteraceae bacterium]|nr:Rrf2 family transcriptional regulator [Chthoniobacteraceae bacterium]
MRISRKAEYALRALVALARHGRPMQIGELSRVENIPVKFLEQILLALRNDGYLTSKRGVGGGYGLRKSAEQILVGDVVRALDGPLAPLPCAATAGDDVPCSCPNPRTCPLRAFMTRVHAEMNALLDARSIEDMAKMESGHALAFDI